MSKSIESTNIPALVLKALQKNNIKTVEELLALSALDAVSVKSFTDSDALRSHISNNLKLKGLGAERLNLLTNWIFSEFCNASQTSTPVWSSVEASTDPTPEVSEVNAAATEASPTPQTISKVLWIKTLPIKGTASQYVYFTEIARLISDSLRENGATIISDEAISNVFEENPWPTEYPIYVCSLALAAFPLSVVVATHKADIVYLRS